MSHNSQLEFFKPMELNGHLGFIRFSYSYLKTPLIVAHPTSSPELTFVSCSSQVLSMGKNEKSLTPK